MYRSSNYKTLSLVSHLPLFSLGWRIILMVFLLALSQMSNVSSSLGALKPRNPNATIGELLEMICRLNKSYPTVNANNIFFEIGNERIDQKFVKVRSQWKASLLYHQVKSDQDYKHVVCKLRTDDGSLVVDTQVLKVAYRPFKPLLDKVLIRNLSVLFITWKTENKTPNHITNYTAYWIDSRTGAKYHCKSVEDNVPQECKHTFVDILPDDLTIWVVGSNIAGTTTSDNITVSTKEIMMPAKVKNLSKTLISPTTVLVTWENPHIEQALSYNLSYYSKWTNTQNISLHTSTNSQISRSLDNLKPHTFYNVSVLSILNKSGLNGDPAFLFFTTDESVPNIAPIVAPGGYQIIDQPNSKGLYSLMLYWKRIPEIHRNGVILKYRITYMDEGIKLAGSEENAPCTQYEVANLHINNTYHFYISAATSKGYNETLKLHPVTVLPLNEVPRSPKNFTVIKYSESAVQLSWHLEQWMTSVTIFWCIGNNGICEVEIKWREEKTKSHLMVLNFTQEQTIYRYGVSAASHTGSSPIHWSTCIYSADKVSDPPIVTTNERGREYIVLKLSQSPCIRSHGFVYGYSFQFCPSNDKTQNMSAILCIVQFLPATEDHLYRIDGLSAETNYTIKIKSQTLAGQSKITSSHSISTLNKGFKTFHLVLIGFGCLLTLILIVVGFFTCFTSIYQCYRKCIDCLRLPIALPEKPNNSQHYEQPTENSSSREPFLKEDSKDKIHSQISAQPHIGHALPIRDDHEDHDMGDSFFMDNNSGSCFPLSQRRSLCDEDIQNKVITPILPPLNSGSINVDPPFDFVKNVDSIDIGDLEYDNNYTQTTLTEENHTGEKLVWPNVMFNDIMENNVCSSQNTDDLDDIDLIDPYLQATEENDTKTLTILPEVHKSPILTSRKPHTVSPVHQENSKLSRLCGASAAPTSDDVASLFEDYKPSKLHFNVQLPVDSAERDYDEGANTSP